jgi:hypothetical protein
MGKYVRWSLGTAAHRRHHQEKRAECTFASTSRGGRQPREREKKKSKQIALSHLCVYPYAHRVYHVFSVVAVLDADVCRVWGDFFFSEVDRKCVTLRRVKAWSPCWLLCGDWTWWGFRIIISSQCVLYVGELSLRSSWDFLVLNDQRWPLLSSHSKMNPHFTSLAFFRLTISYLRLARYTAAAA